MLNPSKHSGTLFTYPRRMESWVDLWLATHWDGLPAQWGYRGGSPTAVQA